MKSIALLFSAGLAFGLLGCDQTTKITNGEIPAELLPYVQLVAGTYRGQFEHRSTGMVAALEGNRLTLKSNDDLIAPACQSKIGNLKEVTTNEKDGKVTLTGATFEFDPNLCRNDVAGRSLYLDFTSLEPLSFNAEILDHYERRMRCEGGLYPPAPGYPTYPGYPGSGYNNRCWWETIASYNTGRFVKN